MPEGETPANAEYLLLSRGQWDASRSKDEVQAAIERFYTWYEQLVAEGRFKPGQRLGTEGAIVSRTGITDGPFTEAKEVIGGYWFIVAGSLQEAAAIAAQNPCLSCGLTFEVRPIETERASAFRHTNETPTSSRAPQAGAVTVEAGAVSPCEMTGDKPAPSGGSSGAAA